MVMIMIIMTHMMMILAMIMTNMMMMSETWHMSKRPDFLVPTLPSPLLGPRPPPAVLCEVPIHLDDHDQHHGDDDMIMTNIIMLTMVTNFTNSDV